VLRRDGRMENRGVIGGGLVGGWVVAVMDGEEVR